MIKEAILNVSLSRLRQPRCHQNVPILLPNARPDVGKSRWHSFSEPKVFGVDANACWCAAQRAQWKQVSAYLRPRRRPAARAIYFNDSHADTQAADKLSRSMSRRITTSPSRPRLNSIPSSTRPSSLVSRRATSNSPKVFSAAPKRHSLAY